MLELNTYWLIVPLHMTRIVLGVCFVQLTSDPSGVSDIILHQQNVKVAR